MTDENASEEVTADAILKQAVKDGSSDVHIKSGSPPKMRREGNLVPIPGYYNVILTPGMTQKIANETLLGKNLGSFLGGDGLFHYDYSYELENIARFRMNVSYSRGNLELVARILPNKPDSLVDLGIPPQIGTLITNNLDGLIIVTGATGSGKSRTMAGMVDWLNKNRKAHIVSIEDPIEVIHEDALANISQKEVGVDVKDFDSGLEAAMRQDPDVILIGEIRSPETLNTVISAAETGHLVVSTLHTKDTSNAINRILNLYGEKNLGLGRDKISGVLKAIVGQRLLPGTDGKRVAVNELMINTESVRDAILSGAPPHEYRKIIEQSENMFTFEKRMLELVKMGRISVDAAKQSSDYPEYFDINQVKTLVPPPFTSQKTTAQETGTKKLPTIPLPKKPTVNSHSPERWLDE